MRNLLLLKAYRVVSSCRTQDQLESATEYIRIYIERINTTKMRGRIQYNDEARFLSAAVHEQAQKLGCIAPYMFVGKFIN